jgi:anti-sigma regulatory factor (Ser/Thr protein kinase)
MPKCLYGDITRIKQIVNNLLSNAIKFTPINGNVRVKIDYDQTTKALNCAIKDSGIGMSDEQQKKIFFPFEQSDATITRKFGGTGLGLTICQSLCELMHGEIQVSSQPDKGATFVLKIPLTVCEHANNTVTYPFQGVTYYPIFENIQEDYIKLIEKYFDVLGLQRVTSEKNATLVLSDNINLSVQKKPVILCTESDLAEELEDKIIYPLSFPLLSNTITEVLRSAMKHSNI